MGLLDSLAGQVLGGAQGTADAPHGGLMEVIGGLLNNPQAGGLQGLIERFEQNGLGHLAASWISTGRNLPISPDQLQAVLGSAQVQAIAAKLGLSTQDVSSHLSELLPRVIDQLTPNGQVPQAGALEGLLGMLKGMAR